MPSPSPRPDTARIVRRLKALVGIDTQNPPGRNYQAITDLIEGELAPLGFTLERHSPPETLQLSQVPESRSFPRTNLVARLDVGARRTLHFNAHFDVVPAARSGWTADPFALRQQAGWLYGRGTADMKGAIACVLEAASLLRETGTRPACNLEFSFVCDEETGSELGAAWLVRAGKVKPDFAIVCEGGSGNRVCIGHNGTLWYDVQVLGKSAHASTPERGNNAYERACDLTLGLRRYAARLAKRTYLSPDGYRMHATLTVGGAAGTGEGAKINTVPNAFHLTLDRRVLANESLQEADRELRRELAAIRTRTPGLKFKLKRLEKNRPCLVDRRLPLPQAVAKALASERRSRPTFGVSTGFNDMHWFALEARIPVVGYGPGGERFHGVDERARLKDLVETSSVYLRLMREFEG